MLTVRKTIAFNLLLRTFIALWLLMLGGIGFAQDPAAHPAFVFTILHTNDLHAHDEPFVEYGKSVGGVSRIASLIQSLRAKDPNPVVVDSGDIFQGTPLFKKYQGEVEVAALNQCGYDLYTIGNHEFDDGPQNLAKQLSAAHFDIISSNLDASKVPALQALIKPSVVKTVGGHKVAFVGAITPDLPELSLQAGPVTLKALGDSWMQPIKDEVARLKSEGINCIVLVTHCGVDNDQQLAQQIPDACAIIGGHSHTKLKQWIDVAHADGSHTLIVQTGCYGRELGELKLAIDDAGHVVVASSHYQLIDINASVPEEPGLQKYIDEKNAPLAELEKQVDGVAMKEFDNRFTRYATDSPIGDLVCDAIAEEGANFGAYIALQNRGGVRGHIDRGLITRETVEEILPFDNKIVYATIPGSTLLKVLEHSVSGSRGGKFLDVHGLKVTYDAGREPGHRIISVSCLNKDGRYAALDPNASYRIGVNDYTFGGGEGYDFTGATDVERTDKRIAAYLESYLIKHKKVSPQPASRLIPAAAGLKG